MRRSIIHTAALVIALAVLPRAAAAQEASLNVARSAFDAGQLLYESGNFSEAAVKFQEAYNARPFAQFLFNIGACHEKANDYAKAIENYKGYLDKVPNAKDAASVRKRITLLTEELNKAPPDPNAAPSTQPSAVAGLGDISLRGLVVIESEPAGASIYLDEKKKLIGKTPWNGTLEGTHTIYVEKEGYKSGELTFEANPGKLNNNFFSLGEKQYLGWVKIESTPPNADIYIDDKTAGSTQQTPWRGNLEPGKHKIWVSKPGWSEYFAEVEVVRGETHQVKAVLEGADVGYLNIRGNVENVKVVVDGEVLCDRGACRKAVPEGNHTVEIKQSGYKTYKKKLYLQPATEMTITPSMAHSPSRLDAYVTYALAIGFGAGGYFAHRHEQKIRDDIQADMDAGLPVDPDDKRPDDALLFSRVGNGLYGVAGLTAVLAVWYTFRDKGPPSTAKSEVQSIAVNPQLGPGYAGLGMGVHW